MRFNSSRRAQLSFSGRGRTRAAKSQYTQAIGDFSEAIWLDPLFLSAYVDRGRAWQSKQEYAKAIVDYNLALRLDPERRSDSPLAGRIAGTG